MIKSIKEVTLKTPVKFYDGETSFSSQNYFSQADISYQSKGVLFDQMNQSFHCFELLCVFIVHWASTILEPQLYLIEKQFGAENISLLSERLVYR